VLSSYVRARSIWYSPGFKLQAKYNVLKFSEKWWNNVKKSIYRNRIATATQPTFCQFNNDQYCMYELVVYGNNVFQSLYKIQLTTKWSRYSVCNTIRSKTDKASLGILIFSKKKPYDFVHWKSSLWDNLNKMSHHRAWRRNIDLPLLILSYVYLELFERQGKYPCRLLNFLGKTYVLHLINTITMR